jgi:hypothetical protein
MSELLARAFGALGPGPSWRELELVGDAVRQSGDEDALAALNLDEFDALSATAVAAGSNGYVALELVTEVADPGAHAALRER